MTEAGEREKRNRYLTAQAAKLSVTQIRKGTDDAADEFLAAVGTLSDEVAHRAPAPGEWSVAEIVDHVAITMDDIIGIMRTMAAGRQPARSVTEHQPVNGAKPLTELLARLRASQAGASGFLADNETEPHPDLTYDDDYFGPLTWKAYAVTLRAHYRDHTTQVQKTLAAIP